MFSSVKNIFLISTLVVTTAACQKARMTHTQAIPEAIITHGDDRAPVVQPVPPQGPPIVTVPLDPRHPVQQPPRNPAPSPAPAPTPDRPDAISVPYTDINNRLEVRTVYDCEKDCLATAPAPTPPPAPPAPPAPAPTPTPEPTPEPEPAPAPPPAQIDNEPAEPAPTYQEMCYATEYMQPDPQQVDILVVADSAGSSFDKNDLTAKAIAAYARQQLRRERHIRIGILPAHGSRSEHSGRLFQPLPTTVSTAEDVEDLDLEGMGLSEEALEYMRNGNPEMQGRDVSNPVVLDSLELELTNENLEFFARTNLGFMPEDVWSDGGQSGLYSLYQALTLNFEELKSQGLFRSGATQHILFISNEADICAESFADPTPERGASSKALDAEFTNLTREQAARLRDCEQAGFGESDLINRLLELQRDYAITVSAIVPTDRRNFKSLHPFNSEETEVGSGYIEVARQTGGNVYDLFDLESTSEGLARFAVALEGQFETGLARMSLTSEFRLEYEGQLTQVTPVLMDPIYDEALLNQNLPEACLTLSEYDARCPNMTVAPYALSAEMSAGGARNTSTVTLQDAGKFGSKVQINFCSTVLR